MRIVVVMLVVAAVFRVAKGHRKALDSDIISVGLRKKITGLARKKR